MTSCVSAVPRRRAIKGNDLTTPSRPWFEDDVSPRRAGVDVGGGSSGGLLIKNPAVEGDGRQRRRVSSH